MKFTKLSIAVVSAVGVAAGGCTAQAPEPDVDSPIGIKRLTVEESDSTLAIVGYAAGGDAIAHIDLRTGTFYSDELERMVEGRQLRIEVRGRVATHESAGQRALKLPLFTAPGGSEPNELLLDPRVRRLLASWKIEINDMRPNPLLAPAGPSSDASTPFNPCRYALTAGCMGNGAYSCATADNYYPDDTAGCLSGVVQTVCCASKANAGSQKAAMRICGVMSSNNPCGDQGPNGCAVCWNEDWSSYCTVATAGWSYASCNYTGDPFNPPQVTAVTLSHD